MQRKYEYNAHGMKVCIFRDSDDHKAEKAHLIILTFGGRSMRFVGPFSKCYVLNI